MQNLLKDPLTEVQRRLDMAATASLFLDFDGTLTSPLQDPEKARLQESTRDALVDILQSKRVALHLDSERSVDDVISSIGRDAVTWAGNHGMEIVGRYVRSIDPIANATTDELRDLTDRMSAVLHSIRGVRIEFNPQATTVHYGDVAAKETQAVRDVVEKMVAQHSPNTRVHSGADFMDILPSASWNRGSAEIWINECCGISPKGSACVDEDHAYADAFRTLSEGITVHAGDGSSSEDLFLSNDSEEVLGFLQWIAQRTKE